MAISAKQMQQIQAMIQQQTANSDGLMSFKAGRSKLKYEGGKKMIYADKKRGKVVLVKNAQDQILHFEWRDRIKKSKELDVMCLPDCAKWLGPLAECKDGNVFVLKCQGRQDEFFWMQESELEEDASEEDKKKREKLHLQIRNLLSGKDKDAEAAGAAATGAGTSSTPANAPTGQAALLAALGGGGGGGGGGTNQAQLAQFQNALMQALGGGAAQQQQAAAMQAIRQRLRNGPDLPDVLNGTATEALSDPEAVARLAEHLPEGMRDAASIREHLNSPQLRGTLGVLQRAVNGENAPMLFQQMGLSNPNDNQNDLIGTTRFLERIQERNPPADAAANTEDKPEEKDGDKKDGDDKMDES